MSQLENPFSRLPLPDPPSHGARNVTLRVDRSAERALRKQHPWLFDGGIQHASHEGETGDLAVIFDRKRSFLAIGLYDPDSPIRVRVLHSGKPTAIDADFFAARLARCVEARSGLQASDSDGYRLVNGENEGLPGLIVDRYADTLVLKLYTAAWRPYLRSLLAGLLAAQPATRVVLRTSRDLTRRGREGTGLGPGLEDGCVLYGPELEGPVIFREHGLRFECDPRRGQKTGFFLDQRENRAKVESLAAGCEVLNVFAYSGGFSLYAARGAAARVVSLDQSAPALAAAERNFALNRDAAKIADVPHETLVCDAFAGLAEMGRAGSGQRRFDLVVVDPPALAKRQAEVARALAAYERLTRLALGVLRPGGTLVMASCSARVPSDAFFRSVHESARQAGRPLDEIERSGHALDHPVAVEFPEGAYLKCLFARTS